MSHETIANITDAINEQVKEWRNRPLDEVYPIVYVDAIRLRIRDGGAVRIKACHLAVGVDVDGVKRVLGMWIEATKGARFRMQVMTKLRNPGIKDVLIVCCDDLAGLPEAIGATWPKATVHTCVVHLISNSMGYASWKDRKAIAAHLRSIYAAATVEAAEIALDAFASSHVGKSNPAVVDAWRRAWNEFVPFLGMPAEILQLRDQREQAARDVEKVLDDHPPAEALTSMPGVGVKIAARLLAEIGGDVSAFPTAAHLAAYAGLDPVTMRSGTSIRGEHVNRSGNKRLKDVLFMAAFTSLRADPASRTYYDRKRAKSEIHNAALICLPRRKCDVLFAMIRDQRRYTPSIPAAA